MKNFGAIIQGIEAALAAAPGIIDVANKVKEMVSALFSADAISKQQQDQLHAHVDAIMEATLAGQKPPHWEVEPDPS